MAALTGWTRNLAPGKLASKLDRSRLELERTVDINRQIRGSRIALEIGQDIDQVPGSMGLCVADDDELDVGRVRRGPKALIARGLQDCLVAQRLERAGELAAPVRVAVDDHGPGRLLRYREPGQGGNNPAGAGEWLGRRQLHQSLGGGELDACARSRKCLDQGMGMAVRESSVRSVTWPKAVAAAAASSSLPSAIAFRKTSARTAGPAATAEANVPRSWAGKELKPTRSIAFSSDRLTEAVRASRSRGCNSSASLASWSPKYPSASPRLIGRGTGTLRSLSQTQTATGSLGNST